MHAPQRLPNTSTTLCSPLAATDERRVTKALLESVLATLEGRSAPRDPIQARAATCWFFMHVLAPGCCMITYCTKPRYL